MSAPLPPPNYDEAHVGNLPLPELLETADGQKIAHQAEWITRQRPALLEFFSREVYGQTPSCAKWSMTAETLLEKEALGGRATMRQIRLTFTSPLSRFHSDLLIYLPRGGKHPVPLFLNLNFKGNQSISPDPDIVLPEGWFREAPPEQGFVNHRATEASRGVQTERFPLERLIARGYGLATAYYGDFSPDCPEHYRNGVHALHEGSGARERGDSEWGSIGAWAWGYSRMADYVTTLPEVNAARLIVVGHSRLGKTALWAGAQDERFAIVISNNSGAGGAALSKRNFGETIASLNHHFPHWFCMNFRRYSHHEERLPVDQHQLLALMAPRPVYVASATEDRWADPQGEFLSARMASAVYALFDLKGIACDTPPPPDVSVGDAVGYHCRTGKHNILAPDWEHFMNFADRHWLRQG